MKLHEVNIRDPFILLHQGVYYLYGTRSATCWGKAEGFDCYTSDDLVEWQGPFEIFHRPEGFFADRNYWAPECIFYQGAFYLITTLAGEGISQGIYILQSQSPTGPFSPYSGRLTPADWTCIDGTVYLDNGKPVLFFSRAFEDRPEGYLCAMPLRGDLKAPAGEPMTLFSAPEAPWAVPFPYAKEEFGMDGDVYFTDGPCVMKLEDGRLYMTWSSWGAHGYAVGVAVSESGAVTGPWKQMETPIFPADGGHGMAFRDKASDLRFTLHFPNDKGKEHPVFSGLTLKDGTLHLTSIPNREEEFPCIPSV